MSGYFEAPFTWADLEFDGGQGVRYPNRDQQFLSDMFWPFRNRNLERQITLPVKRSIDASVLEKRILFSASPAGPPIDQSLDSETGVAEPVVIAPTVSETPESDDAESTQNRSAELKVRAELVFIDSGIEDYQRLVDEFITVADGMELEIYLLDADRDGITQISEILADHQQIDAVHVLSHGNDSKLRIGNAVLDAEHLDGYAGQLALWNESLSEGADLLLYGCDLAESGSGQTLMEAIAALTGADVTASKDDTGHTTFGGDWDLEFRTGSIESGLIDRMAGQSSWVGLLSIVEIESSPEQLVNTTTTNVQQFSDSHQSVAVDGLGNSVVTWVDYAVDGSGTAVMAQRFDQTGAKLGSEFRVNVTTSGNQSLPVVAADATGRFAIAYVSDDDDGTGIFLRRFDASGTAIDAADILVNSGAENGTQSNVSIASNNVGQIVLVWESNGSTEGIFSRQFDFTSTTVDDALSTPLILVDSSANASRPVAGINAAGRIVVGWDDSDELYGRKYDFGSSTPVAAKLDLNVAGGLDRDIALAVMDNGDYVIAYRSDTGGGLAGVWQRLVHNDDSFESAERVSSSTWGDAPAISMDSSGNYVITYGATDAFLNGVYYQSYDSYANVVMAETLVNQSTNWSQYNSSVAIHGIDNFVVTWSGYGDQPGEIDNLGVFLRQFGTAGTNTSPIADLSAGAPYSIAEGETLSLSGIHSSDADGNTLSFAWDLDNDGLFGEIGEPTSATATVDWSTLVGFGIDDDGAYTIGLRVDDGQGGNHSQTTTLTVNNSAPVITVSGTGNVAVGQVYTLGLSATDFGDDTIVQWRVDWGDGTIVTYAGNPSSVTHSYSIAGLTHNILVSASDEDGTWFTEDMFLGTGNAQPVRQYDALTGDFEMDFGTSATLNMATDVLYGPDGLLYVAGRFSDNVQRFDPQTGNFVDEFIAPRSGGLKGVTGMDFGADGHLYVSSHLTDEVLRYNGSTGAFIDVFVAQLSGGLHRPGELFFAADGLMYVISEQDDSILRFNGTTGAFVDEFIASGSGGLNVPTGFSFGADGMIYVASQFTDEILRYDGTTGAFVDEFVTAGSGGLDAPYTARFGPDGMLYVSGYGGGNVLRYDDSGNFVDVFIPESGLNQVRRFSFSPSHQVVVTPIPNTVPSVSNLNQSIIYTEDDATVPLNDIVVTDTDSAESISVILTLDLPATGTLTTGTFGASTSTYNVTTGAWSIVGSVTDVNAALAAVAFTPSADNDVGSRITVHVEDALGAGPSDGVIELTAIPQNDAPRLDLDGNDSSGAAGADIDITFVEGNGAVGISDPTDAFLSDVDSETMSSLTVTITNLLDGSDESLSADTTGTSIIAVFGGGTLTLSGTDTISNYQQVLRTLRYNNTSTVPDPTTRLVQVTAHDGSDSSNASTATITIVASNDPPQIDLDGDDSSGTASGGFATTFTEGAGPVAIVDITDAFLLDPDSPAISSLTVSILNLFNGADEILSADTTGTSIVVGYANGVLTLIGSDSPVNYEQVLRTIQYTNQSDSPDLTDRLVSFVANDGGSQSTVVTATLSMVATNDPPLLDLDANDSSGASGTDFNATFSEGGGAVLIVDSSDAILSDADSGNLTSMTVTITNLLGGLAESLSADTSGTSINANYFAGTLTLSGADSVAHYQQVLRTVRYDNTSFLPNTSTRVIEFTASDGAISSAVATASVVIQSANDAPTLDLDADNSSGAGGANYRGTFTEGAGAVLISDSSDTVLNDVDSPTLDSLTATISNPLNGAAETLTADTTGTSITAIYSGGTLTLSGVDTVANYQHVLRTIRYNNSDPAPDTTTRVILVRADDGIATSNLARARISIVSVNNPPSINAPGTQSPMEDVPWTINGISVSDADLGSGVMELSFDVSRGRLTFDVGVVGGVSAANVQGNGTSSLIVSGTVSQINATLASTNGLVYIGNQNFWGSDLLVLSADDALDSSSQTVSIMVQGVNDQPVAVKDRFVMPPNQTLVVKSNGLLANDDDVDGDFIWIDSYTQPTSGSLVVNPDGSLQFTPKESFSGLVSFSYTVSDGIQSSAVANVVIQVSSPIRPADIQSSQQDEKVESGSEPEAEVIEETQDEEESTVQSLIGSIHSVDISERPREISRFSDQSKFSELVVTETEHASSASNPRDPLAESGAVSVVSVGNHMDSSSRLATQHLHQQPSLMATYVEFDTALLWQDFDHLKQQMNDSDADPFVFAGTVAGFSSALSVGYVIWTIRGGLLATSLLANLPAWSFVDPLLVLSELDEEDEGEDDSLETMIDKHDTPSQPSPIDQTQEASTAEETNE